MLLLLLSDDITLMHSFSFCNCKFLEFLNNFDLRSMFDIFKANV